MSFFDWLGGRKPALQGAGGDPLRARLIAVMRLASFSAPAAALIALAACGAGGGESNSSQPRAQEGTNLSATPADSAPAAEPASEAAAPARPDPAAAGSEASATGARRCGWLHNPTPGNWWLTDRDGEWILATQGGRQADGMDEMPDMSAGDWQEVNGHYGYGCACLTLTADPRTREVRAVAGAEPKPLAQCRADRALPRP